MLIGRYSAVFFMWQFSMSVYAQTMFQLSGHPDLPPFSWKAGSEMTGVAVELTQLLVQDLKLPLHIKYVGNWKQVQIEAQNGLLDGIIATHKKPEREKYLLFPTQAFTQEDNVMWIWHERPFTFNQIEDLIGQQGVRIADSSYGEIFEQFAKKNLKFHEVSGAWQAFKLLEAGRATYYPANLYSGQIQVKRYGYEGRVIELPYSFSQEGIYWTPTRQSRLREYLPVITERLQHYQTTGITEKLIQKHLALYIKTQVETW